MEIVQAGTLNIPNTGSDNVPALNEFPQGARVHIKTAASGVLIAVAGGSGGWELIANQELILELPTAYGFTGEVLIQNNSGASASVSWMAYPLR